MRTHADKQSLTHTQKHVFITAAKQNQSFHSGFARYFWCRDLMFLPQRVAKHQPWLTEIQQWHNKLSLLVVRTEKRKYSYVCSHFSVDTMVNSGYYSSETDDRCNITWLNPCWHMCDTWFYIVLKIFYCLTNQYFDRFQCGVWVVHRTSYIETCVTWYNLDQSLKITYLLMNSKHTSFPPFDFLQPGTLKFIRLFKLISSVENSFWLIVHNDEDNTQLKFISQTDEKAIYT